MAVICQTAHAYWLLLERAGWVYIQYGKLCRRVELETADAGLRKTARERKVQMQRKQSGTPSTGNLPAPAHLSMVKNHLKVHYTPSIRFAGTIDSYSTSEVCQSNDAAACLCWSLVDRVRASTRSQKPSGGHPQILKASRNSWEMRCWSVKT
jgi:hypothetical protein